MQSRQAFCSVNRNQVLERTERDGRQCIFFARVEFLSCRLEPGESDAEFWQVIPRLFHGIFLSMYGEKSMPVIFISGEWLLNEYRGRCRSLIPNIFPPAFFRINQPKNSMSRRARFVIHRIIEIGEQIPDLHNRLRLLINPPWCLPT